MVGLATSQISQEKGEKINVDGMKGKNKKEGINIIIIIVVRGYYDDDNDVGHTLNV